MSGPRDRSGSDGTDENAPMVALVDGFEDFERVGRGGFSSVYSARQIRMGRPVAIKVLDADVGTDADRQAFERECQAMGLLSRHPNIATVYSEAYTIDGRPCLVMELYHGNYRDRLEQRGPLPLGEFLALGVKIAGALQAAHDLGILHRDIKPHNIFLSDFGEPALGDFGISTIEGERSITGAAALSVGYSAPEVIDDDTADFLSDVYSLAATLHHLLAGALPFAAPRIAGVVHRIMNEAPDPIERDDVPQSLHELLRSGLAKRPSDRPDSAGDIALSLQEIQAELGFDRTPIALNRAERLDPDVGADWANSSVESSQERVAMRTTSPAEPGRSDRAPVPPDAEVTILPDAEATVLPPGGAVWDSWTDRSPPLADQTPPRPPRPVEPPTATPSPTSAPSGTRHDAPTSGRTTHGATPRDVEPTIQRHSAAYEVARQASRDLAEDPPRGERRGWIVDAAIVVAVVALVAFALSRML